MTALEASNDATVARYNKRQERIVRDQGYGATDGAVALTQAYCRELAAAIPPVLTERLQGPKAQGALKGFAAVACKLDPLVVAASVLQSMLSAVAVGTNITETVETIGRNIHGECWAAKLLQHDERLHARIKRVVSERSGSVERRRREAQRMATRAGYRSPNWSPAAFVRAGTLLLDCALDTLPELFHVEDVTYRSMVDGKPVFTTNKFLQVWPTALAMAEAAVEDALCRNPVFVPCREAPEPWRSASAGGYWDERTRLGAKLVRTPMKAAQAAVRAAFNAGSMSAHVSAVNALQAVPWRIDGEILSLVQWADQRGMLSGDVLEELPRYDAEAWEALGEQGRKRHTYEAAKRRQHNRTVVSNRVQFAQDITQARLLVDAERFYTPINCDWRGRVYGVCNFNFQRNDTVRAMFKFADGVPLGDDGLYWLKVHCANSGAFDKIDKAPFAERIAWVDKNIERIKALAWDPKSHAEWWMQADAPFLFVAASLELTAALSAGPTFVTRLPVSFDGSCSGLQHLCAMTRSPEGQLVNLTPNDRPQDVYQVVADVVTSRVRAQATATDAGIAELAALCLDYGIDRKLVKRNVMTFPYSSKVYGMRDQLIVDTMERLELEVLKGSLPSHPFGEDNGRAAAKYLAHHIYSAIEQTVSLPAAAMGFLQQCARALAHEGKPLQWTTPCGLPWANRYHKPTTETVELWLQDRPVKLKVATGTEPEIWKSKAADAVAPNFVHACDAAHLLGTVNACISAGITSIATVHDSFGCHAAHARRFNQIIREEFVRMYAEHDVLAEVLASAKRDLSDHNHHRLPEVPTYGSLQLEEVLNADYAFA